MAKNEGQLDQFNQQLRSNPQYLAFLQSIGVNTYVPEGQAWRLSDEQRKQAEAWVRQNVGDIGKLEIDISGNANQNEGFGKQAKKWGPIVAAGVTGLGALGIGPMAGLMGAGGSGSAASGVAGSGAAGGGGLTAGLMGAVPANIASQGVSAGLGSAAGLGGAAAAAGGGSLLGKIGSGLGKGLDFVANNANGFGALGAVTSGAAAGSAAQRNQEYNNKLRSAQFDREGQDRQQKQAMLMQLLNNTKDFDITPGNANIAKAMGTSVGGARPSNLTTNRESLLALLGAPQIQAPKTDAGALEKTLGGVGLGTSLLQALGQFRLRT